MTMNASEAAYDLVLTGARIYDPATGLDRNCDLAVNRHRIAAIGAGLASHAGQVIELDGKLLTAGWVDLHVHVFEWMTTFGLPPDDVGIHSGVTPQSTRAALAPTRSPPSRITSPTAR